MEHITIKVNNIDEAKVLSSQMRRLEPEWTYSGNIVNIPSYYTIYFKYKETFEIIKLCCDSAPESSLLRNAIEYSNCDFFKLPSQIQDKIIELSTSKSYIPFVRDICASDCNGGFCWGGTKEGGGFWGKVLAEENFELFFEHFNTKKDENRLCKEDPIVSGDSRGGTAGICCRRHKITITVNNLSNKALIGRG